MRHRLKGLFAMVCIVTLALGSGPAQAETVTGTEAIWIIQNGHVLGAHFSDQMLAWLFLVNLDGMMWQCSMGMSQTSWRATCFNGTG